MGNWFWFKFQKEGKFGNKENLKDGRQFSGWRLTERQGGDLMKRLRQNENLSTKRTDGSTSGKISVLLCDDHPLFLLGLKAFLEQKNALKVIGETSDTNSLLKLAAKNKPQIIVMDMSSAKRTDFAVLHQLSEFCPETKVVIITGYCDEVDLVRSIRAGVMGLVSKSSDPELIMKAISTVSTGKPWIQREFTEKLIGIISDPTNLVTVSPIQTLSGREKEILKLVSEGMSNKEIAARLHLSVQTVKVFLTRIFHKLGVRNRVEAAQYALVHLNEWTE